MKQSISFDNAGFAAICRRLAKRDPHIREIIAAYGYPPVWSRKPSFETLVHIILEQQVSLASAKAALVKLKEKIGTVTPKKLLLLSDAELKKCYFSRQKISYCRCVAEAIESGELSIKKLQHISDEEVRIVLTKIKGIGNWTVDVYLMMVLHRADLFPTGDIALINSVKHVKQLPAHTTKDEIAELAEAWRPHRTVAAFIFWHAYIRRKNIRF
ncbi:MAG: DNA-3-methyladenine glycosylase 2 family protein [Sediminibacterium sp.]